MTLRVLCSALVAAALQLPAMAQNKADWVAPTAPFRISGNLYYVGSRDLAAYLITTPKGNILINANLVTSPPQIRASVEKLGFKWSDTKLLLSSQSHYDHAAGSAEVLKETGAKLMVMDGDVKVMEDGGVSDYDHTLDRFTPVHVDRVLHDMDKVQLGGTTIVAHKTAGHTQGCTTWTMDTHESGRTLHVVIVGGMSWNPAVRLVSTPGKPASYPGIEQDFQKTFATLNALPVDIFLGAHGVYFDFLGKMGRWPKEGDAVWIDPVGYHQAVNEKKAEFEAEVAKEKFEK